MLDKIAILGYSGHGFVVADAAIEAGLNLTHYCERSLQSFNPFQLEFLGSEFETSFNGFEKGFKFILGVGDNQIRAKIAAHILAQQGVLINVLHPTAILSKYITMGSGSFISSGVVVQTLAKIGNNCILNTGCIIEHECEIGNNVHIAPSAVCAGNVRVGDNSFVGANAVIKQGVKIGNNVTIGAGAVIIKDVPSYVTMIGNPGKLI